VLLLPAPCCRPKLNHDLFFFMPADTEAAAPAAPCSQQRYHQCQKYGTRCIVQGNAACHKKAAAVSLTSNAPAKIHPGAKTPKTILNVSSNSTPYTERQRPPLRSSLITINPSPSRTHACVPLAPAAAAPGHHSNSIMQSATPSPGNRLLNNTAICKDTIPRSTKGHAYRTAAAVPLDLIHTVPALRCSLITTHACALSALAAAAPGRQRPGSLQCAARWPAPRPPCG
jgi:hypothetical protein